MYNEILRGEAGPEFVCYTLDKNDNNKTIHSCKSSKPTTAVNNILKCLNFQKTRNWSGYEFFGFNRSDVIHHLNSANKNEEIDTCLQKKTCVNANNYPELVKIAHIQNRQAGKTESLFHQKSKNARNETIHNAVKLASQDDVESMKITNLPYSY